MYDTYARVYISTEYVFLYVLINRVTILLAKLCIDCPFSLTMRISVWMWFLFFLFIYYFFLFEGTHLLADKERILCKS